MELRIGRWYCVLCGKTSSVSHPDFRKRAHACNLVILVLLWCYLSSDRGYEHCAPSAFGDFADQKKIMRYMKRAKKLAMDTQQSIREVVLKAMGSDAWEELFLTGLSPPESLRRRQRGSIEKASILWRAFEMLLRSCMDKDLEPSVLLARAQECSSQTHRQFLI